MEELLALGEDDMNRHHVIRSVLEGKTTQAAAAKVLRLCERQVRRLCGRVKEQGARGLVHGLKGRQSNHQLDVGVLEKALSAIHDPLWEGFHPTFVSDKLQDFYGIELGRQTVRRWMARTGLWQVRPRGAKHRQWRPRKPCLGLMTQLDGSDHDWFEGRGPKCVLLVYIDDATSHVLYAEFVDVEDTLTLMRTTWTYLRRWGRPASLYVDRDSIYTVNPPKSQTLLLDETMTQFTRAMSKLGVTVITANSPQAKGRVERGFHTHQDRLVKELRLAGICDKASANRFLLEVYIPDHNRRCAVQAERPGDVHRPLLATHDLAAILAVEEPRVLQRDFTIQFEGRLFQLQEQQPVRLWPKAVITVQRRLDGSIRLLRQNQELAFDPIERRPYAPLALPTERFPATPPRKHRPRRDIFISGPTRQRWQATAATPVWR